MTNPSSRVIAVIRKELGELRVFHAEQLHGEITPDTELSAIFESEAIDRVCVACALDEAFGIELSDVALERWATVADVIESVAMLAGEDVE